MKRQSYLSPPFHSILVKYSNTEHHNYHSHKVKSDTLAPR